MLQTKITDLMHKNIIELTDIELHKFHVEK